MSDQEFRAGVQAFMEETNKRLADLEQENVRLATALDVLTKQCQSTKSVMDQKLNEDAMKRARMA